MITIMRTSTIAIWSLDRKTVISRKRYLLRKTSWSLVLVSGVYGCMQPNARLDEQDLFSVWARKLEQERFRVHIVDVLHAQADQQRAQINDDRSNIERREPLLHGDVPLGKNNNTHYRDMHCMYA
jgi:hypothetical protein